MSDLKPCEYGYCTPDSSIQRCKHPEAFGWKCCVRVCEKLIHLTQKLECVNCPEPECEGRAAGCAYKPKTLEENYA